MTDTTPRGEARGTRRGCDVAPIPDAALSEKLDRYKGEVSLLLSTYQEDGGVIYVGEVPDQLAPVVAWLEQWSPPIRDVTPVAVRALVTRYDDFIPKHVADLPPPAPI